MSLSTTLDSEAHVKYTCFMTNTTPKTPVDQAIRTIEAMLKHLTLAAELLDTEEGVTLEAMSYVKTAVSAGSDALDWLVLDAVDASETWSDIASHVGTSRQGAQQKYGTLRWSPIERADGTTTATKWREPKLDFRH